VHVRTRCGGWVVCIGEVKKEGKGICQFWGYIYNVNVELFGSKKRIVLIFLPHLLELLFSSLNP